MGIAALVTALVLHVHAVQARQQLLAQPVMPAQGTVTSPFGQDGGQWHPGIDIGVLRLLTAHAAAPAVRARQQLLAQPVMPAEGTITSPFGHDGARWHPGIDIGVLRSLTVRAAVPGRVVLVGEVRGYEGYGNVVVVRSRGYQEIYGISQRGACTSGSPSSPVSTSRQQDAPAGAPARICTSRCARTAKRSARSRRCCGRSRAARSCSSPRLLVSAAPKRQPVRVLSFVAAAQAALARAGTLSPDPGG